jgi:hypothetical protein
MAVKNLDRVCIKKAQSKFHKSGRFSLKIISRSKILALNFFKMSQDSVKDNIMSYMKKEMRR